MRSRLRVIAGRVALWAAVILVVGRGLVSLFVGPAAHGTPSTPPAVAVGEGYPTAAAQAFAARFTADYLTFDETNPADWTLRIAAYGTDTMAGGWDGKGHQTVSSVIPGPPDITNSTSGIVPVSAQTSSGWLSLAVPVAATPTGLAVAARPAFVALPTAGHNPNPTPAAAGDPHAAEEFRPTLEAFLAAYATGQQAVIHALSADGARLPELEAGRFTLTAVDTITVPATPPGPSDAVAVVTLRWADARSGAGLTQTYRIGLTRVGERWLVSSLGAARLEPPQPPTQSESQSDSQPVQGERK